MWRFGGILLLSLPAAGADYGVTVAPLLAARCGECHSAAARTSGFSIASAESVIAGGNKHGRAVDPGHPEKSPIVRLLKGELQPAMPFGKSLSPEEIARIEDAAAIDSPELGLKCAQTMRDAPQDGRMGVRARRMNRVLGGEIRSDH